MNVRLGPIKSADTCLGSTVSTSRYHFFCCNFFSRGRQFTSVLLIFDHNRIGPNSGLKEKKAKRFNKAIDLFSKPCISSGVSQMVPPCKHQDTESP